MRSITLVVQAASIPLGPLAFVALLLSSAASAVATIDFEDFELGGATTLRVPATLIVPDVGGSGITVTLQTRNGQDPVIWDLSAIAGDPTIPGQAYLASYGLDIFFSEPIDFLSLDAGDFGVDDDSPLQIQAFDANGVLLAMDSASWPESGFWPFETLEVSASGISKVVYSSGGSFPNSTFVDNLTFVPEPSTALLLASGLAGLAWRRRGAG